MQFVFLALVYHLVQFLITMVFLLSLQTFPSAFYDLLEQSLPFYNMLKSQVRRPIGPHQPPLPDPPLPVPANKKILVWVGDELLPHDSAKAFALFV